ncbi:hypothetical protein ACA910_003738 [Epithemia clementina (nom. ined.)]
MQEDLSGSAGKKRPASTEPTQLEYQCERTNVPTPTRAVPDNRSGPTDDVRTVRPQEATAQQQVEAAEDEQGAMEEISLSRRARRRRRAKARKREAHDPAGHINEPQQVTAAIESPIQMYATKDDIDPDTLSNFRRSQKAQ